MIDLNEKAKEALENAEKRNANGANIKTDPYHMLKHAATEVIEAQQAYDGVVYGESEDPVIDRFNKAAFNSELADIVCCVLIIAGKLGIDIEQAINLCIEKNRKRAEKKGDKI